MDKFIYCNHVIAISTVTRPTEMVRWCWVLFRAHTASTVLACVNVRTVARVTSSPDSATVRPGSKVNSASTDVHQVGLLDYCNSVSCRSARFAQR